MIKFGTGGFRGIIGENFTKDNVQKIAQALAKIIKKEKSTKPVLIGYDLRFLSDRFAKIFAEVLAGNKISSYIYNKPIPTPAVMYGVKKDNFDYGITITASHNPYYYNGVKLCVTGGIDADEKLTNLVEKIANSVKSPKTMEYDNACKLGLIKEYDNIKDYVKNLTKLVSKDIKNNNLSILFNTMHGVTTESANLLAKAFNIKKFTLVNDSIDPYFEYKVAAPNEELLEDFKKNVVKGHYSIGFACDEDGDRLGVVDEAGNYYGGNMVLAVVYYYLVKYRNMQGDVVINQSTSSILKLLAEKFGYNCHETNVGFKWISAGMRETDALIGGESSGGLTMRNYTPCKDSLFAISLLLDAMAIIKKPFSKIVEEMKEYCGYISTYVEKNMRVGSRKAITKALSKYTPSFSYKPVKELTTDGHKYYFEDGSWAHLRFSGTENLLRYHVEFPTEIECERNIKNIENFIKRHDKQ